MKTSFKFREVYVIVKVFNVIEDADDYLLDYEVYTDLQSTLQFVTDLNDNWNRLNDPSEPNFKRWKVIPLSEAIDAVEAISKYRLKCEWIKFIQSDGVVRHDDQSKVEY